ncbi:MAG: hypothetical protein ACOC3V_01615 [bacterium]
MITKYNNFLLEKVYIHTKDILKDIRKYDGVPKQSMYNMFSTNLGYGYILNTLKQLRGWLYNDKIKVGEKKYEDGLGLRGKIEKILKHNEISTEISDNLKDKFEFGINKLLEASVSEEFISEKLLTSLSKIMADENNTSRYKEKEKLKKEKLSLPELVKKYTDSVFLVKDEKSEWHHLNKLNTNYIALSELLTNIIFRAIVEKNDVNIKGTNIQEFGKEVYSTFMSPKKNEEKIKKIKKVLLKYKVFIGNLIHVYYGSHRDKSVFDQYVKIIKNTSRKGEEVELETIKYLKDIGFEIKYYGGDGDFVDMVFGVDLIAYRKDMGYKTIQVKSYKPTNKEISDYDVDWIAYKTNVIEIIDKNTLKQIIL